MRRLSTIVVSLSAAPLTLGFIAPATAGPPHLPGPAWQDFTTGSTASLHELSPVSWRVAWASGSEGEVLRTVDGGDSWQRVGPPGTDALQFRDIQALDERHAVILSIGNGEDSRVYRTDDGGAHWTETFRNTDAAAFYDCMAFFDRRHGLALSDPVDGKFRILSTSDGGGQLDPRVDGGHAGRAGRRVRVRGQRLLYRDGRRGQRLVRDRRWGHGPRLPICQRGQTWTAVDTAIPSGPSAGIYSVAFRDSRHGLGVGGDFAVPDAAPNGAA